MDIHDEEVAETDRRHKRAVEDARRKMEDAAQRIVRRRVL